MDKKHVHIICDNLNLLISRTNKLDDIIDKLMERGILNIYMVNHLRKSRELKRQTEEFYLMMLGRGPKAFDALVAALRETENFRAEQLLSSHKLITLTEMPSEVNLTHLTKELKISVDELDNTVLNEVTLVVKRHPEGKWMDVDDPKLHPNGVYRMRSRPRGHALLININKYEKTSGYDDRIGSEVDERYLHKLFEELGYKVFSFRDLNESEMKKLITGFSWDQDLKKVDSLVVFIMCHGKQPQPGSVNLITRDGGFVLSSWIIDQFVRSPFHDGRRKPKMFFFQTCRVDPSDPKLNRIISVQKEDIDAAISDINSSSLREEVTHRRPQEDIILVFSTLPGYVSYRSRKEGTWFVQAFCEVVAEHAWEWDVETMIGRTDEIVRRKKTSQGFELTKQASVKKIFFNPHLYEEEDASETGTTNQVCNVDIN